jgi:exonuclease III
MKLMSLNIWGGTAGHEKLFNFFKKHQDVDVFCLQEVWEGGRYLIGTSIAGGARKDGVIDEAIMFEGVTKISEILGDHAKYYRPIFRGHYGLLLLVKKNIEVLEEGEDYIYKEEGYIHPEQLADHARNIHWVRLETPQGPRLIAHVHGLWNGKGKSDSEDRLLQSNRIIAALKKHTDPTVLCGDFNLMPETESVKKIEGAGFRNLITENGITSTRTSYYPKPEKFADYMFVDKGITVNEFKILPDEVSDHAPLYLDFT